MKYILTIALILSFYFYYNKHYTATTSGASMTPCFEEGRIIEVYPNKIAEIGDTIQFKCNVEKCHNNTLNKFLVGKKGSCIYVIGCNKDSFDSKQYGWLCGDEYKILGVTK
jgi:hypothetical protein